MALPPASSSGLDFINALSAASTSPNQGGDGKDLPDGFPMTGVHGHRVIDSSKEEGIEGASAYDYTAHRQVFLIYRPWSSCNRCAQSIVSQKVTLPDDEGDITCAHTQVKAYKEILDRGLAGQLILGSEQETTQRDGTIVVSMKWYEMKINYKKMRQAKKKLEREVATQTSEDPEPDVE